LRVLKVTGNAEEDIDSKAVAGVRWTNAVSKGFRFDTGGHSLVTRMLVHTYPRNWWSLAG
jgi:hypothetical protein